MWRSFPASLLCPTLMASDSPSSSDLWPLLVRTRPRVFWLVQRVVCVLQTARGRVGSGVRAHGGLCECPTGLLRDAGSAWRPPG